jgi:rubredoxin
MKCSSCGNEISAVKCHIFDFDGSGSHLLANIMGGEEGGCYFITVPKTATMFEFEDYFEEFKDHISCPVCDKFPFGKGSISIHEHSDVVFGVSDKDDFE